MASLSVCNFFYTQLFYHHFTLISNSEPTLFFFHQVEKTHLISEDKRQSIFLNFGNFGDSVGGYSAPETRSGVSSKLSFQTPFTDHLRRWRMVQRSRKGRSAMWKTPFLWRSVRVWRRAKRLCFGLCSISQGREYVCFMFISLRIHTHPVSLLFLCTEN